jgi:HD-like signal output (HDOD) protein
MSAIPTPAPVILPKIHYTLRDWKRADELPASVQEQLLKRIDVLPRPPGAVQLLLSQEFIDNASSPELAKVVMSEPAVAAKVIATVNSPLYKLRNPVSSIGQAITFLGVNQVRAICIQRLLTGCFASSDNRVGVALDSVWRTNSAATLLLPKLVQLFRLPDAAALTSQVILSFVGQMGVAALMPVACLGPWGHIDLMLRCKMEEQFIGVNATEIGALVLRSWGIPETIVAEVSDINQLLVTPAQQHPSERAKASAVGFLCVWMAEQLTRGLGSSAASPWSPLDKQSPELQAWFSYLALPGMEEGAAKLDGDNMQGLYQQIRDDRAS